MVSYESAGHTLKPFMVCAQVHTFEPFVVVQVNIDGVTDLHADKGDHAWSPSALLPAGAAKC